ncbi:hypothetical protein [Nocardioides sp. TF02-7]|uniref:hypothetical protein n=1 Tax=Nocardioides sp. TF02-7 TaxID=2917724 RepID=UPI001F06D9BE|nr:hypothetical protein [Nocardioides sp. TF02-7]UMG91351.1 hypothetical protein MF408_14425 [Nocardioides sp. TF02-7]
MYQIRQRAGVASALSALVALAVAVATAVALASSSSTAAATSSASATHRHEGVVRAAPGQTVVRGPRGPAYTDGTTRVTYRIPGARRTGLRVAADARAVGRTGYRAILRFGKHRKVLRVVRAGAHRAVTLGKVRVPQRIGRKVRVELQTDGDRIRARAWDPGKRAPRWQVTRIDRKPLARPGTSRARVHLGDRAQRPVSLQFWLASVVRGLPGGGGDPGPSDPADPGPTDPTDPDPTVPPPGSGQCPAIGIYNEAAADRDVDALRQFDGMPQVANSYYQPAERIRMSQETARIKRGTSPNITITTKGTDRLAALGLGPSHPGHAAALAWLDQHLADLATLTRVDPAVPVYATLEHEYKVKIRLGMLTGQSADPKVYGKALDLFYARAATKAPQLRTTYWIVGSDRAVEGEVGEQFVTLPDAVLFDPYAQSGNLSLTQIAKGDLDWIQAQSWYRGQEVGLGEFGMQVRFGDAALAKFYTGIREQMADLGLAWGVFFNRQRDLDTRIVERSDGKTFPKAVASFSTSLKATGRC